jgi:chromosome segregation ATPase
MSTDLDLLAHSLGRIRDYSSGLTQPERKTIQSAIDVLPSADKALDASLPVLATLDSLLAILADVPRYKKMLGELTAMIRDAKQARDEAKQAAADLAHAQSTLGPSLASARAAHERTLEERTAQFDAHVADYQKQLAIRSDALRVLEERTRADAAENTRLKEELQKKLDAIRTMAA